MLQAFLWAVTAFFTSLIMSAVSGSDDGSFIHNVAGFFAQLFAWAFWGCLAWLCIEVILWALPIMIG